MKPKEVWSFFFLMVKNEIPKGVIPLFAVTFGIVWKIGIISEDLVTLRKQFNCRQFMEWPQNLLIN